MATYIKETITTPLDDDGNPVSSQVISVPDTREASLFQPIAYFVYFFFGALEILLAFRFIFKLTGASTSNILVGYVYNLSNMFIAPFNGIFQGGSAQGSNVTSIFEPATLVAILVFAIVASGIVMLLRALSGRHYLDF